jgi:DNA polymerase
MSQLSARSTAFLQEMGIGVQWQLRHAPQAQDAADAQGVDAGVDLHALAALTAPQASSHTAGPAQALEQAAADTPTPPASQPVPVTQAAGASPAAAIGQPASQPLQAADVQWAEADSPAADVQRADTDSLAADAQRAAADSPAADVQRMAPAPQPPRAEAEPQRVAAAPSDRIESAPPAAPIDDESTAWFDDAPTPPPAAAPARTAPVSDEAIAEMDWDGLRSAVTTCTRCPLCTTRRAAIPGRGAENARWIAIAAAPTQADEQAGEAISGAAGQLLDNMLKAIELRPQQDVYVATLVKCRPATAGGAERAPSAEEVVACRPFLDRELALTGATMAMTFGQFAARGLMMGPAARGKVMRYGASELPVVATYHPDDLLRKPEDKAKAWADLCLARSSHG